MFNKVWAIGYYWLCHPTTFLRASLGRHLVWHNSKSRVSQSAVVKFRQLWYPTSSRPANCPTFRGMSHFVEISATANFTVRTTENDANFTWKFSFSILTSLWGKFNYEKPSLIIKVSQTSTLWIFLFLGNVHAHGFGQCPTFWLW